jgi:hypothetical protein
MGYGALRQQCPTICFFSAAVAEAVAIEVHEMAVMAVAVVGMAEILFMICYIEENFIEGIVGIGGVAFGAGVVALASGVMDDFKWVVGFFGLRVARGGGLQLGAIGCNCSCR